MARRELVRANAGELEAKIPEAIAKAKKAGESKEIYFEYSYGGKAKWSCRVDPNDTPRSLRSRLFK